MSDLQSSGSGHINPDALGLTLQFADGFDQEYGAPDQFDTTRWIKWKGEARTENGYGLFDAVTTPGEWGGWGHFHTGKTVQSRPERYEWR